MTGILGDFGAVILCDDIRREITNKDILIGVYGPDIVFVEFPITITMGLYLEYFYRNVGEQEFFLRLGVPGRPPAILTVRFLAEREGPLPIVIPGIQIPFTEQGELSIEASTDQTVWRAIKRKKVLQGPVQSLLVPTVLSSAPGDL